MESIKVKLFSSGPMLMHCATTANPLHPGTIAHKSLTSKRKKTEEDQLLIARSEFILSLYFDKTVGVYLPGINIESCIFEAAKLRKLGKIMKRAILVQEDQIPLSFKGPREPEKIWENVDFVDARPVKVGTSKIMRYRPLFKEWSCEFTLLFNPEQIDRAELVSVLQDAGALVGLGDFRPRFGKFSVEAA